ncbi:hypothetical protein AE07_01415 [Enterobacter cloacae BWH 43]|nr:hypothetical protein AE07_01415 [Enterobacter cloacae BWH 43]
MVIAVMTVLLVLLMIPAAIHILLQLVGGWCDM